MRFAEFPTLTTIGAVLGHSVRLPEGKLPKGHVLQTIDVQRLIEAGITQVVAARLEEGDLGEDQAVIRLARAIKLDNLRMSEASTGRVNIYAATDGLFVVNKEAINRLNRIDPAITLACLSDRVAVRAGDMVATFKIIPLAVPSGKIDAACRVLLDTPVLTVKPFVSYAVWLIATELPTLKASVMAKTACILERRLALSGSRLLREVRVAHRAETVAAAIRDAEAADTCAPKMIIIFGASAVADEADVIPEAIRRAGGQVIRVGMPVDPGNLLVFGRLGDIPIIGAPGCARSPKENGFDWLLSRVFAGENPTSADISELGVGGLLVEIPTRPYPRDNADTDRSNVAHR